MNTYFMLLSVFLVALCLFATVLAVVRLMTEPRARDLGSRAPYNGEIVSRFFGSAVVAALLAIFTLPAFSMVAALKAFGSDGEIFQVGLGLVFYFFCLAAAQVFVTVRKEIDWQIDVEAPRSRKRADENA